MSPQEPARPEAEAGQTGEPVDGVASSVEGERGQSAVQRPPSLQSRLNNLMAVGLMGAIGVGLLAWYYANWVGGRTDARDLAQSSVQARADAEINLRPLGRVDGPSLMHTFLGDAPPEPPEDIPDEWLWPVPAPESAHTGYAAAYTQPVAAEKSPQELRRERLLAGPAFSRGDLREVAAAVAMVAEGEVTDGELESWLRPTVTPAVQAQVLRTQRLLLPKGAFLDCTLETAIDSTLPGMTTCILATDTFSADGRVVLLERGTKLVGETRGEVRQGAARLFVLWTEARTPRGVVVPLASPGTDELGRSGLPGVVNRHFFERFGAAILVSVIDGAIQAEVASRRAEGSTVIVDPSGTRDIMTEVLRSTVNIPPTIVKPQGDRIQVLVARDLDFRSVYELRPVSR